MNNAASKVYYENFVALAKVSARLSLFYVKVRCESVADFSLPDIQNVFIFKIYVWFLWGQSFIIYSQTMRILLRSINKVEIRTDRVTQWINSCWRRGSRTQGTNEWFSSQVVFWSLYVCRLAWLEWQKTAVVILLQSETHFL